MSSIPTALVVEPDKAKMANEGASAPKAKVIFFEKSRFSELLAMKSAEPLCLFDVTGSTALPASEAHPDGPTRRELMEKALEAVAGDLQKMDTLGKKEKGGGGVMTTVFADGDGTVLGDVNPENFKSQWKRIAWGGRTYIVPGWKAMKTNYFKEMKEEYENEDDYPLEVVALLTDGEAEDVEDFTKILKADSHAFVCIILIGDYRQDTDHQKAIDQFTALAESNHRVHFMNHTGCVDYKILADDILSLFKQAVSTEA